MDIDELNILHGKILKARLRGDEEKAKELEAKLQEATKQTNQQPEEKEETKQPEEESKIEFIAPVDSKGRLLTALISSKDKQEDQSQVENEKKRDKQSESMSQAELDFTKRRYKESDLDSVYMKNILKKGSHYKETHSSRSGRDEDEEIDMSLYVDKTEKMTEEERKEYEMKEAIKAHKKWMSILDSCHYCFDNPSMPKQMLISIGEYTYLTLPLNYRVTPFHCQIVPLNHVWSLVDADEEVAQEIQTFQQALTRMAKHMHMGILFMEDVRGTPGRRHCVIDCIPVPKEVEQDAPLYFKKELQDADEEWQAASHKVIDTTKKGIRRSIPKGFSYFHVQWSNITGPAGGYAHLIDNERSFPLFFGYDVLCGMMDLGPMKARRETNTPQQEKDLVHAFLKKWKHYDWTRHLDGGEY